MKNLIKNISIIALACIAIISISVNVITLVHNNTKTSVMSHSNLQAYLETIDKKIKTETNYYNDEDLNLYTDISTVNLAVLISNKDYPVNFIDTVAKNHGYEGYTDMVYNLIDLGLLVYIPEYTHPEHGIFEETIVTPNTIGYEMAVETGVIKEVK